jgi:hypothetical protein
MASAPNLEQVTGRYFANGQPKKSSERSYDQAAAADLWPVSARLVGLTTATDAIRGLSSTPNAELDQLAAGAKT